MRGFDAIGSELSSPIPEAPEWTEGPLVSKLRDPYGEQFSREWIKDATVNAENTVWISRPERLSPKDMAALAYISKRVRWSKPFNVDIEAEDDRLKVTIELVEGA